LVFQSLLMKALKKPKTNPQKMTKKRQKVDHTEPLETDESKPSKEDKEKTKPLISNSNKENTTLLRSPEPEVAPKIVIAFSNFREGTPFDDKLKDQIMNDAIKLNAQIKPSGEFEDDITHVICPPNTRTLKTLSAYVKCRWVGAAEWVLESAKIGKFLPDENYGIRPSKKPFVNKKFFISKEFLGVKMSAPKVNHLQTLIKLGEASLVDNPSEADYVVTQSNSKANYPPSVGITWIEFLRMIVDSKIRSSKPTTTTTASPFTSKSLPKNKNDISISMDEDLENDGFPIWYQII